MRDRGGNGGGNRPGRSGRGGDEMNRDAEDKSNGLANAIGAFGTIILVVSISIAFSLGSIVDIMREILEVIR